MRRISTFGNPQGRRLASKGAAVLLLAAMLLALAGCSLLRRGGGGSGSLGSTVALEGQATLVCSGECRGRGQCGASDLGDVVLLSSLGPATRDHNIASLTGTVVSVEQRVPQTVVQSGDGQQFQIPYYLVTVPGRGLAWVAGWCIAQ